MYFPFKCSLYSTEVYICREDADTSFDHNNYELHPEVAEIHLNWNVIGDNNQNNGCSVRADIYCSDKLQEEKDKHMILGKWVKNPYTPHATGYLINEITIVDGKAKIYLESYTFV